jgi:hypothetical protein
MARKKAGPAAEVALAASLKAGKNPCYLPLVAASNSSVINESWKGANDGDGVSTASDPKHRKETLYFRSARRLAAPVLPERLQTRCSLRCPAAQIRSGPPP